MYIKKLKKSICNNCKIITVKVKKSILFALNEAKEAICHIGRIILLAFLKAADAIDYAVKKIVVIAKRVAAKIKESMHPVSRTDFFILAALLIIILTPIIVNLFFRLEAKSRQVNLYLSVSGEEFFGKELMETLIHEFEEKNPDIRLKYANNTATTEPDILFFNDGDLGVLDAEGALMDSGTRQIAIPLVSFMNMLFYNIDILTALRKQEKNSLPV